MPTASDSAPPSPPHPSSFIAHPSPAFWLALEAVPGGSALPTTWKRHLDKDFQPFSTLFLTARPDQPAQFVPCPWNCGCLHEVVPQDNGKLHGFCQCNNRACGTYTVGPEETIPLELDWSKLADVLCRAFDLTARSVKLGLYNTLQIGSWSTDALPVILTLSSSPPEFLNTIAGLIARFAQPFILLTPTDRHVGLAAKELLANTGAGCFSLKDHLRLDQSGALVSATPPEKLFAQVAPLRPPPSDEEIARRTFLALQAHDQNSRRQTAAQFGGVVIDEHQVIRVNFEFGTNLESEFLYRIRNTEPAMFDCFAPLG